MNSKNIFSKYPLFILLFCLMCTGCKKEEITGPTVINITNTNLFERLPINSIIGSLSTDLDDMNTTFRLIAGEGDAHNNQFEVNGLFLRTKTSLSFADGATRSVRVQATNGGVSFEKEIMISVEEFSGVYPTISSPSFIHNERMPREFGADHGNISPDLILSDIPEQTVSMVLAMNDLDDGGSYHWAVWNIPPNRDKIFKGDSWGGSTVIGNNDFGTGYVGPFPPREHRYQITVYFLKENLTLETDKYYNIITRVPGKIIAQTSMIGKFKP